MTRAQKTHIEATVAGPAPFRDAHYRDLRRRHFYRLLFTYLMPLVLLSIYFALQYNAIVSEGRRQHLVAIAESQANTLDLFLNERRVDLKNLIDDPDTAVSPEAEQMKRYLAHLKNNSEAFLDLGAFDESGVQHVYAGPHTQLARRDYSGEEWFQRLVESEEPYIITDVYLGFRQRPHFTLAVKRSDAGKLRVLRATLDPERIYEYVISLKGSGEVDTSIVNSSGRYQLVMPHIGKPLTPSPFVPPRSPEVGIHEVELGKRRAPVAYAWLRAAPWALAVKWPGDAGNGPARLRNRIAGTAAGLILLTLVIILNRANKLVELQKETDRTRAQLEHAAKLASVGELAAGIAHEINNPLASISEEAGLMVDLMNPEFGETLSREEMLERLDSIQDSTFRCRDITSKLLGFVRKTELELRRHDVNEILDEVLEGLLGAEFSVSNIEVIKQYHPGLPRITTDSNQLQQVILNIVNNARDAIGDGPGRITARTSQVADRVSIDLTDTGCGMTSDQLEKIFMPFYTTKDVGKGTGLGLSVSYGIVRSLGGRIEVESERGVGSRFSILLPVS